LESFFVGGFKCYFSFIILRHQGKFAPSTVVPAAEGKVKVKKDKNNNYAISIDVENLAEPSRLPMPQNYYIAWLRWSTHTIQNLASYDRCRGL
jgi:hypothetical protein